MPGKIKFSFLALFVFMLVACAQKSVGTGARDSFSYVKHPDGTDSLCISEIDRAKQDSASGKLVFTQRAGFMFGQLRYISELRELCKVNGLEFRYDLIGCVRQEGQTQGCYGDYMDMLIAQKFGPDFKRNLHKQADSLFLIHAQNDTTEYWDCDERPRLPNEKERHDDYLPSIQVPDLDIHSKSNNHGVDWPFIDLGFIVNTDSTVSGFVIRSWVATVPENEQYKDQLFTLAVNEIKTKYPKWVPGKIDGIPITTYNNIRFHFVK